MEVVVSLIQFSLILMYEKSSLSILFFPKINDVLEAILLHPVSITIGLYSLINIHPTIKDIIKNINKKFLPLMWVS